MYTALFTVALFVAPVFSAFAVSQPDPAQCAEFSLSWPQTSREYNVILTTADAPCGEVLQEWTGLTDSILPITLTQPAGQVLLLSVQDSEGAESWTQPFTIRESDNETCLPGYTSSSTTPSSTPATRSVAPTTSTSTTVVETTETPDLDDIEIQGAANVAANQVFNAAPASKSLSRVALALSAVVGVAAFAL